MKAFDEFIATGDVRKQMRDLALARSLMEFAKRRMEYVRQFPTDEKSAFLIFETVYEALREMIDSLLALEGYKSYSHVACISYLQKFQDITPSEIAKLDNAREKRNRIKYYAQPVTRAETKELLAFYKTLKPKFLTIFKQLER